MSSNFIKTYNPNSFVPTTSYTGKETPLIIKGENMWVRFGRFGSIFGEGYSGNLDLSESIPNKLLTGTIAWTSGSTTITGSGTAFLTELHLGSFVLGDGGAGFSELLVVEEISSNTSFTCSRAPTSTKSGKSAYVLPVIFPVGINRGTAIRGNVIAFPRGNYLGVGDGDFRINGSLLNTGLALSKTPRFAIYDATTGLYTQEDAGIAQSNTPVLLTAVDRIAITSSTNASPININATAHGLNTGDQVTIGEHKVNTAANGTWTITKVDANNFTLNGSTGNGVGVATGYLWPSGMRAGAYNVRVCRANTKTSGFSNPTPPSDPLTLTANQSIKIQFQEAMLSDQDAYDIYVTPFEDNSTATIEARYMGPWYYLKTVTADDLKGASFATGREKNATCIVSFADSEIVSSLGLLTFDNFAPEEAEFVDILNDVVVYFSCLGKGTAVLPGGTSPGPSAIATKPDNPEGSLISKAVSMAGGDYIIGEFNAKSRVYVLGQNSLQIIILTTLNDAPIAFRSLWNTGFRNPYNVVFVKEYLYAFSTHKILRSVAGGDDSTIEFEFASDVRDYITNWKTGHVLTGYDPKNRAVVFFYSAFERRSGYWVTVALPFLLDQQVWNPPIILRKSNTDFIVSGVATVGENLTFIAGGRALSGSIITKTYIFDGGDSETKDWYLAWNYSDDGAELFPKTIQGISITGRFASANTKVKVYGVKIDGEFDFTSLEVGTNQSFEYTFGSTSGKIVRNRVRKADAGSYPLYTIRASGSYTTTVDRLDEIALKVQINNSEV